MAGKNETTVSDGHFFTYGKDKTKKLHYLQAGPVSDSAELIIFMHGWPGIGKLWYQQLANFARQGYRVIAPDMPGWGQSTGDKVFEDYAQENVASTMLEFLNFLGHSQAIWIAHDWGCATLWSIARRNPEVCKAVCGMTIPYATMELGVEELMKVVNRHLYPETDYPYGQWSYQIFYEKEFEKLTRWYEQDIQGFLKSMFVKSNPAVLGTRAPTANVVKDGGRAGGADRPLSPDQTPESAMILDQDVFEEFFTACEKTGFWTGNAWYMNHSANRHYNFVNGGYDTRLKMPVLFIEARFDTICDTATSQLAKRQEELCDDLTYVSIDAGHFVAIEKWQETNKHITDWLIRKELES